MAAAIGGGRVVRPRRGRRSGGGPGRRGCVHAGVTSTNRNSAARSSWSWAASSIALRVERPQRVTLPAPGTPRGSSARLVCSSSSTAANHMLRGGALQSRARPPFALRRRDRGRRSGSRPTRRARSRCSARASRTFRVAGHHYALVPLRRPRARAAWHEYEVRLDGERVWPLAGDGFPPSAFHTYPEDEPLRGRVRLLPRGGPARAALLAAQGPGRARARDRRPAHARAAHARRAARARGRTCLLMIGDQVYADEVVARDARVHRGAAATPSEPPGEQVLDFEEYTRLYRESWSDPAIRWLFSTRLDGDDLRRPRRPRRLEHLAGLARGVRRARVVARPHRRRARLLLGLPAHRQPRARRARRRRAAAARQGGRRRRADPRGVRARAPTASTDGTRWSYCRDLGRTPRGRDRLARRARARGGPRARCSTSDEWEWVERALRRATSTTCCVATSLPWLLGRGDALRRGLERGRRRRRLGRAAARGSASACAGPPTSSTGPRSRSRSSAWPSCCARSPRASAAARRRRSSSLSGDVHHAYLFEVAFPRGAGVRSHVFQAVCSPYRNPLDKRERQVDPDRRVAAVRAPSTRALAASAGVDDPPCAGGWSATARGSTTRSPRCASTAARSTCASRRRCRSTTTPRASNGCSTRKLA